MPLEPSPGTPRELTVLTVEERMERMPYLPMHERRFWAKWYYDRDLSRSRIPDRIRREVYERDGYRCLNCGTTESLSLDHIIPWSLCGPDTVENLQTLCKSCNSRKGAA